MTQIAIRIVRCWLVYETFQRMVLDARTRVAIDQHEKFKGAKELFVVFVTRDTRNNKQPGN